MTHVRFTLAQGYSKIYGVEYENPAQNNAQSQSTLCSMV